MTENTEKIINDEMVVAIEVDKDAWCHYCTCENCRTGVWSVEVKRAKTSTGKYICDACYGYGVKEGRMSTKPKLISEWTKEGFVRKT